jgi:hypothetical protein
VSASCLGRLSNLPRGLDWIGQIRPTFDAD